MVAFLREEVSLVKLLLETGASLDARNPGIQARASLNFRNPGIEDRCQPKS